jgi:aminopeptidase
MSSVSSDQLQAYARLLVRTGINLQPEQSLLIRAELEHAPLVRLLVAEAYQAGARYVHTDWLDTLTERAVLRNADVERLEMPAYDVARFRQMTDESWGRLALVGPQTPTAFDDVDPQVSRAWNLKRLKAIKFYRDAQMSNQLAWCVAAVPTVAWARQVFPELEPAAAVDALWAQIVRLARADAGDPVPRWAQHNANLQRAAAYLQRNGVQTLHFFDPQPGPDGAPATDLRVGLAEQALWVGGTSTTPAGVVFQPNIPTEEVFTTPHSRRVDGYVRTSRPSLPMDRKVDGAWFRFEDGAVVEFRAEVGQEVLATFFEIAGARRLGEVALVDARSPVFQSGLLFHEILFDENAACHIAFGQSYPECVAGGSKLSPEELVARGANESDTHVDFMIGTATLRLTGHRADGSTVAIMENGMFLPDVLA